jgi:hypothetical protein
MITARVKKKLNLKVKSPFLSLIETRLTEMKKAPKGF